MLILNKRVTTYFGSQRYIIINLLLLQRQLENIYDIHTDYDINHFVFHDLKQYDFYRSASNSHHALESLFIQENPNGFDLSLYLDKATIKELSDKNPFESLNQDNLAAFCLVAEGISHFVYLIWSATHHRPVSQLELELQAEVDKYILCASILAAQTNGTLPGNLCEILFENISFCPNMTVEQQKRYRFANLYAKHYCYHLHLQMLKFGESKLITKEIRRFYRLWHHYKFKRIDAMPTLH